MPRIISLPKSRVSCDSDYCTSMDPANDKILTRRLKFPIHFKADFSTRVETFIAVSSYQQPKKPTDVLIEIAYRRSDERMYSVALRFDVFERLIDMLKNVNEIKGIRMSTVVSVQLMESTLNNHKLVNIRTTGSNAGHVFFDIIQIEEVRCRMMDVADMLNNMTCTFEDFCNRNAYKDYERDVALAFWFYANRGDGMEDLCASFEDLQLTQGKCIKTFKEIAPLFCVYSRMIEKYKYVRRGEKIFQIADDQKMIDIEGEEVEVDQGIFKPLEICMNNVA